MLCLASGAVGVLASACGTTVHKATPPAPTTSSAPAATSTIAVTTTSAGPTTTTPATSTSPAKSTTTTTAGTTTAGTTTSTVPHPPFAPVVDQAMQTIRPRPPGLEAPDALPGAPAYVSAEATGLGGTYSVTLVATDKPVPVNSPQLAAVAAKQSSDLGSFSTIPASSPAVAAEHVQSSQSNGLAPCTGASTVATVPGARGASSCPTPQGVALNWHSAQWLVQVGGVGGAKAPLTTAAAVAGWLASHSLPAATGGVVSVSVPESSQAGSTSSTEVMWYLGSDVYEVTALRDELAALDMAASMRPWPAG